MKNYNSTDISYTLGMSLTLEALRKRPDCLIKIIISDKIRNSSALQELYISADKYNIAVEIDDKTIKHLSVKENCFVIGFFKKFHSELHSLKHIVLDSFTDEGVLGTTIRSAISFNSNNIVLTNAQVDLFSPKTVRSSMGAIFHCELAQYDTLADYQKDYANYHFYPLLSEGEDIDKINFKKPYAVILPNKIGDLDKYFKEGFSFGKNSEKLPPAIYAAISLYRTYLI